MKRFFIFLVIMLILPGLVLLSADAPKSKVKKIKGARTYTVKGFTRSWKDVRKLALNQRPGPRKMKPIMNFQNPRH